MEFSAKQIAELIEGVVVGDPDATVNNVSKIEDGKPGTISFLSNPKYTKYIYETKASIVLVNKSFEPEHKVEATMIQVEDAYVAVAKLMQMYAESMPKKSGIEQPSYISESASIGEFPYVGAFAYLGDNVTIGDNVSIYPNAYIGDNVTIGDNTVVYAGVKIYQGCKIGSNCILHAGSVVGSDGFGFAPGEDGVFTKIPQLGNVVLEDDVEIGANTTVDRATMGSTIVHKGVKLDNLIQIAHNAEIGDNTVMAALTAIAGSAKVGKNCMFGGHTGVAGHLTVADEVKLSAYTAVSKNVTKKDVWLRGIPAQDAKVYARTFANFKQLPNLAAQVKELKEEIKKLKGE
ncbi:UDP-3-O-(3-hydroxymyristoyl)glucosamine N-acyltransferase [Plebeiibacterium marinum]|uniref:UDP-3-O-acylglucosamine N-acyltransferase n=1 Tax=Plebeiibacterium marinum TaxID=2992111 RepID=A0AAE3MC68_9BACT|nr:UDP-3-O-(3-hydroxymyristoyl)glucosamine N-acyltransferase [Plebeiobacterium marinum]MCW3805076.1 UDP-3-O-(3-hydroxymyristoyl)glucosamine N-acyltransferase [Plebeiobacterium marinum]